MRVRVRVEFWMNNLELSFSWFHPSVKADSDLDSPSNQVIRFWLWSSQRHEPAPKSRFVETHAVHISAYRCLHIWHHAYGGPTWSSNWKIIPQRSAQRQQMSAHGGWSIRVLWAYTLLNHNGLKAWHYKSLSRHYGAILSDMTFFCKLVG